MSHYLQWGEYCDALAREGVLYSEIGTPGVPLRFLLSCRKFTHTHEENCTVCKYIFCTLRGNLFASLAFHEIEMWTFETLQLHCLWQETSAYFFMKGSKIKWAKTSFIHKQIQDSLLKQRKWDMFQTLVFIEQAKQYIYKLTHMRFLTKSLVCVLQRNLWASERNLGQHNFTSNQHNPFPLITVWSSLYWSVLSQILLIPRNTIPYHFSSMPTFLMGWPLNTLWLCPLGYIIQSNNMFNQVNTVNSSWDTCQTLGNVMDNHIFQLVVLI